ncbi:phosphoglycerate kinase [Jiangella asiatica]|uniref:Phosphoglycerate kinase n=1 Tax=Jiangella asiatica TaxID=2530372 RepID=A0A4R5D7R2_9ACTN|nr:phosphoglycerate kinase [Jiangella asiatica]TDE07384.1 phosphoglycerate kinase [Jiangella asiatica]
MKGIDELGDPRGKRVLLRSDLNVPLEGEAGDSVITDDGRIRASVPTVQALRDAGARVVVVAHLGRPKGSPDARYSLAPVAKRLSELLGAEVAFATDTVGESARKTVASLNDGDVALLENLRFDARETSKDDAEREAFARELAELADVFVSDGFGVVHRKQASVYDVATLLPHAAGQLVLAEVRAFSKVLDEPERPYVVVLGGSKVSDKLGVIDNLLDKVDRLLIGGGMAFTFLAAQGYEVGGSLLERDQIDTVRGYIERAADRGVELVLPVDVVVAAEISADAQTSVVPASAIPADQKGLDIGPATIELFRGNLADAKTVVWNGPMGVFELTPFAGGTREVAVAISSLVDGTSVVGGGDSAAAVRQLGLDEGAFTHISTGGGASLELLEGKKLPGLTVLED